MSVRDMFECGWSAVPSAAASARAQVFYMPESRQEANEDI